MPLLPLLLGVAPTVASWILGDRTGAAVEKVTGIAREILGTDDPTGIEAAIARDPNAALQFKTALIQAEADARRLEHDSILAQLRDVQSAREQTVRLAEAKSPIAYGAVLVSAIVLVGFAVMLWLVIREEVPANQRDMVTLLLGTLAGMASSVVAYWVGRREGDGHCPRDPGHRRPIGHRSSDHARPQRGPAVQDGAHPG